MDKKKKNTNRFIGLPSIYGHEQYAIIEIALGQPEKVKIKVEVTSLKKHTKF